MSASAISTRHWHVGWHVGHMSENVYPAFGDICLSCSIFGPSMSCRFRELPTCRCTYVGTSTRKIIVLTYSAQVGKWRHMSRTKKIHPLTGIGAKSLWEDGNFFGMVWYYLRGLGTLCVPNHVDYTCSFVTWYHLYGRKFTNSCVTFPKARNHLKAKNLWTDSPNHSCVMGLHHGVVLCRRLVEI